MDLKEVRKMTDLLRKVEQIVGSMELACEEAYRVDQDRIGSGNTDIRMLDFRRREKGKAKYFARDVTKLLEKYQTDQTYIEKDTTPKILGGEEFTLANMCGEGVRVVNEGKGRNKDIVFMFDANLGMTDLFLEMELLSTAYHVARTYGEEDRSSNDGVIAYTGMKKAIMERKPGQSVKSVMQKGRQYAIEAAMNDA